LPSRTAAIMPHPHEQKLHEVVNSLTFASFNFCVAALTVDRSRRSPSASPAPPPIVNLNQSRRLIEVRPGFLGRLATPGISISTLGLLVGSMVKQYSGLEDDRNCHLLQSLFSLVPFSLLKDKAMGS
jgi:hypothetical protein